MTANSISVTALQIINAALSEIGALAAGETASSNDQAWVLQKLQRLIDQYNARDVMIYTTTFAPFTIQANLSPHTIGPTGTFVVNQRPRKIPSIGLVLQSGGSQVEIPLYPRDRDWWAGQTIKNLNSTIPTDYYYEPDWPNGSIYFWPVPNAVNGVLIQSSLVLSEITAFDQTFSLPPGYWDAVVYPLAISLCPSFERQASQELIAGARQAVKAIQESNIQSPRLASDAPSQSGRNNARPDFSFLTGLTR